MKAAELSYECPKDLQEAIDIKNRWGSTGQFLAGGQSLLPAVNMRLNTSACLIDLNRIDALRGIRQTGERIVIGAMTRHAEIVASPLIRRHLPVLVQAGRFLAHAAIRNRGTLGGSLALFDPAAEWPAACLLLDADINTFSSAGRRTITAGRFIQGLFKTDLDEDGLIESVTIPIRSTTERSIVLEQARRLGDFASAAVMARGVLDGRGDPWLRLVLFAIADRPLRLEGLERDLVEHLREGRTDRIEAIVKEALAGERIVADLYHGAATKRHLIAVLTRRAVFALSQPDAGETAGDEA